MGTREKILEEALTLFSPKRDTMGCLYGKLPER